MSSLNHTLTFKRHFNDPFMQLKGNVLSAPKEKFKYASICTFENIINIKKSFKYILKNELVISIASFMISDKTHAVIFTWNFATIIVSRVLSQAAVHCVDIFLLQEIFQEATLPPILALKGKIVEWTLEFRTQKQKSWFCVFLIFFF